VNQTFDFSVFDWLAFDASGSFTVDAEMYLPNAFRLRAVIKAEVDHSFRVDARFDYLHQSSGFTINATIGALARVSQMPLEVLVVPQDAYLRVSQTVIEVLVLRTNGHIDINAVIRATPSIGFSIRAAIGHGAGFDVNATFAPLRFTVDAVRSKSGTGAFTASAIQILTQSKTTTVKAAIKKTLTGSVVLEAWITPVPIPAFRIDAFVQPYFFIGAEISLEFKLDALILKPIPGSFPVAAVIFGTRLKTLTVNAIRRETFAGSFVLDAETVPARFRIDAIKGQTTASSFSIDSRVGGGGATFSISAVILATVGPGLRPLTFPGTSRTRGGLTTNALSPIFPINTGEQAVVVVDSPPSDGGDLGIVSSLNAYAISTDPGEYDVVAAPGQYYVASFKGNVYRPTLTGAGWYKDWSTGLQFTIGAFIRPFFTIDARFVWTFGSTFTANATVKAHVPGSFTVAAFIRPTFRIDARIASRHFSIDAWIKCEFTLDAWLSRRVTGSFTVDAFVRGAIRVNAIVIGTRSLAFPVAAWFTHPVFGSFSISASIQPHFEVDASKVITYYRHDDRGIHLDAWKISGISSSFTLDARIRPHFRVDAVIFGRSSGSFDVGSYVSNAKLGSFSVGAFIEGAFRLDATLLKVTPASVALDSAIVRRPQGSFTISAGITGFLINAVIKGHQQAFFSLFAYKTNTWKRGGSFTIFAEKYDASAYWDQYWELWLHPHFYIDAIKAIHPTGSFKISAAIILPGQPITSFFLDAAIVRTGTGDFLLEAFISSIHTVVYEGEGEIVSVLENVSKLLDFPGANMVLPDGAAGDNVLSEPFWSPDFKPVTITVWGDISFPGAAIGIDSANENLWAKVDVVEQGPGITTVVRGPTTTITFWPSYSAEPHYVYVWTDGAYKPSMTGSGLLTYSQQIDRILSYPAPTIDAWIVGTLGEPITIDAEIVGLTKQSACTLDAEIAPQGEVRGSWLLDASILGAGGAFFYVFANVAARSFTLDACLYQIHFTADAFVQPYLYIDAAITRGGSGSFHLDAWSYLPTKAASFVVEAEIVAAGDRRGSFTLDALVLGEKRGQRIYLAANIAMEPAAITLDAMVAPWFGIDAWIAPVGGGLGAFTIGAYVRGSSFIIFPEDGGAPTDPLGNPPALSREFSIKIEAGIPRPIPIGNDAEIERLITLILEAEAELDALYCAVENFTPQGYTAVKGPSPNPSGGGYNRGSSLPGAISQIGYPNAGDIDDCWLVATVWAAVASGQTYRPDATTYRRAAMNPDRPGPTGGTADQTFRGAKGCWPGANIRRYVSTDWNGFTSLLKAGWVASLAVNSGALPGYLQYGFYGLHQIGVAYQNGQYYVDNPLMSNGTSPVSIDEIALRTAARGFSGGVICATMFG
jgi:hypothetical protein